MAALLWIVAGVIGPVIILVPLFRSRPVVEMVAPGTNTVTLNPGKYGLWNDYKRIFQGTTYNSSSNLPPGSTFRLVSGNNAIQLMPDMNAQVTFNNEARELAGSFHVPAGGNYSLEISGEFPPRVFSLRRAQLAEFFGRAISALALGSLGWIAGPLIALITFFRRSRSRRA